MSDLGSLYSGIDSSRDFSAITMPAACVEACLSKPSKFIEISNKFLILLSFLTIFLIALFSLKKSFKVTGFAGLKGIILQNSST